jgi:bacillopeptidase F (M6 metalloprotease family)
MGTVLNGSYHANQAYASSTADSPDIDLTTATSPQLVVWVWSQTEGTLDGANLKISQDNGATYSIVPMTPAYDATVSTETAWAGDHSAQGWRQFTSNLSAFAGHHVKLRLAFRSDGSVQYPGVYVDDLTIAEPVALPLSITTPTLPNGYVGNPYAVQLTKAGGTTGATWSIIGGTNAGWLSIDPSTGLLTGTPSAANMGAVSVQVRVQQPTYPSNADVHTYNFNVGTALYVQSFDATCPGGWTLTGEWQCGTPSVVGPATAFSGSNCLGTVMNNNYSNGDTFAATTATSPQINLVGASTPSLTFKVWLSTESCCDGFNVKVSNDGGATFAVLSTVTPAYTKSLGTPSEQCWGSDQSAMGWQTYTADLSAFAGQNINLRFAFQSDGSVVYPGVYIDDVVVSN